MEMDPRVARWGLVGLSGLGLGLVLLAIAWTARRDGRAALHLCDATRPVKFRRVGLLLAGFVLLTLLTQLPGIDAWETAVLRPVYRRGSEAVQSVIKTLSDGGRFLSMCLVVAVLSLLLWHGGRGRSVRFFLVVMAGELALESFFKLLVYRARPPLRESGFFDSYPSGHALGATILVGALLCLWLPACRRRWHRLVLWSGAVVWPLLIGGSRVYLGRHYVSDVLGSFLLGAAWVMLCRGLLIAWSQPAAAAAPEPEVVKRVAA